MSTRLGPLWSLRIVAACLAIPPLVRVASLDRLLPRLGRAAPGRKPPSGAQQLAIQARVARILSRLPSPWRGTCLTRSAVVYHLLGRSGIPVALHIGVRREAGALLAHAWVEHEGGPALSGEAGEEYEEIARFRSPVEKSIHPGGAGGAETRQN